MIWVSANDACMCVVALGAEMTLAPVVVPADVIGSCSTLDLWSCSQSCYTVLRSLHRVLNNGHTNRVNVSCLFMDKLVEVREQNILSQSNDDVSSTVVVDDTIMEGIMTDTEELVNMVQVSIELKST